MGRKIRRDYTKGDAPGVPEDRVSTLDEAIAGRAGKKKGSAEKCTLEMFTRDRAPGVTYVKVEQPRNLVTTKPGNAMVGEMFRDAIVRIEPQETDTDDEIASLKSFVIHLGAARVFTLPRPKSKVLPEQKMQAVKGNRSLRDVVQRLMAESAFDDKPALIEFVEGILAAEGL